MAGYLGINSAPVGRTARTGLDFQAQQESAATNSVPDAMLGLSGDLGYPFYPASEGSPEDLSPESIRERGSQRSQRGRGPLLISKSRRAAS
jgi:hypothetical protein